MILPLLLAVAQATAPTTPSPRAIAPGVTLLPGSFEPGRGPDGATVVFDAPDGLVVVDTGRHVWHSDAILAFAETSRRPVAALLNTHWHLDHSSGNGRLKARYPAAQLYASDAVGRVLAPGGFLVRSLDGARAMLAGYEITEVQREEVELFLATMESPDILRPDIVIAHSGPLRIAGKRFDVRVTDGAVTDADVWLYDRRSRVAVIGDLVTLPAPFFETACPERWRAALDEIWSTPFRIAVPGHGAPMNREQFATWRAAYGAFVDCVTGDAAASDCARGWTEAVAALLTDERTQRAANQMAEYYVGFLRQNGGASPDCRAN